MESTLAEAVLLAAVIVLLYRLMRPLQRWLEDLILRTLDPRSRPVIDVTPYDVKEKRRKE